MDCVEGPALTQGPSLIAAADWSASPEKRWQAQAFLQPDGSYLSRAPEKVCEAAAYLESLREAVGPAALILAGFDFPIGLPLHYARLSGIVSFLQFLKLLDEAEWQEFYKVADQPDEISLRRPFYPNRPGGARRDHLVQALGANEFDELRRICERAQPNRRAASPLFWTLGGQQVGKAAISGWKEVIAPALRAAPERVKIWPFSGALSDLFQPGNTVIAEIYPAEYYLGLGISFSVRAGTHRLSSKRSQFARAANAIALLGWAANHNVQLSAQLSTELLAGFGPIRSGEDRFDAVAGLFGMLGALQDRRASRIHNNLSPPGEAIAAIEGWILGQEPASR
jgi:hypothetical protein